MVDAIVRVVVICGSAVDSDGPRLQAKVVRALAASSTGRVCLLVRASPSPPSRAGGRLGGCRCVGLCDPHGRRVESTRSAADIRVCLQSMGSQCLGLEVPSARSRGDAPDLRGMLFFVAVSSSSVAPFGLAPIGCSSAGRLRLLRGVWASLDRQGLHVLAMDATRCALVVGITGRGLAASGPGSGRLA